VSKIPEHASPMPDALFVATCSLAEAQMASQSPLNSRQNSKNLDAYNIDHTTTITTDFLVLPCQNSVLFHVRAW
jgi:hypothetical protein